MSHYVRKTPRKKKRHCPVCGQKRVVKTYWRWEGPQTIPYPTHHRWAGYRMCIQCRRRLKGTGLQSTKK